MLLPSCFCSGTHQGSWWGLCHAIPWACNALIPRLPVAVPFHSPSQPFPDNQSTWTTWYPHVPCAQTISWLEGRFASQVQRTQNSAWFPEVASEHRGWWLAFMNEWANEQRNMEQLTYSLAYTLNCPPSCCLFISIPLKNSFFKVHCIILNTNNK